MRAKDILERYERMREQLNYLPQSPRNTAEVLWRFLDEILEIEDPQRCRLLVLETLDLLGKAIRRLPHAGVPPEFYHHLAQSIERCGRQVPLIADQMSIDAMLDLLHGREFAAWSLVGEPDQSLPVEERSIFRAALSKDGSPREVLDALLAHPGLDASVAEHVVAMARAWDVATERHAGTVWIPVVEQDISGGGIQDFRQHGRLVTLRLVVDASGAEQKAGGLKLTIQGIDDEYSRVNLERVCQAAEQVSRRFILHQPRHPHSVVATFSDTSALVNGTSYSLGLATLLACTLSRQSRDPLHLSIADGCVFTGAIDAAGAVLAVSNDSICEKLEAVFHSPSERFILPKGNEQSAQERLDKLCQKYPHRSLNLIPVTSLDDVCNHREVVRMHLVPMTQRMVNVLARHARSITIGAIFVSLLSILTTYILGIDFDNNPHHVKVTESQFLVQNRNGRTLWSRDINPQSITIDIEGTWPSGHRQYCAAADLDGDGTSEVLMGHPHGKAAWSDSLYCCNADGSRRWSVPIGRPIVTQENDYSSAVFHINAIMVDDADGDGRPSIFCTAVDDNYAGYLYEFDINGRRLQEYFHPGALWELFAWHRPNEPTELIAFGTHNGFDQADIVVFDPACIRGAAPQEESHRVLFPQFEPGLEKRFILFPRCPLSKALNNMTIQTSHLGTMDEEHFCVDLPAAFDPDTTRNDRIPLATLIVLMDSCYRAIRLTTSSDYDRVFATATRMGYPLGALDAAYRLRFLQGIRYWDGEGFVAEPAINSRYLEHIARTRKQPSP